MRRVAIHPTIRASEADLLAAGQIRYIPPRVTVATETRCTMQTLDYLNPLRNLIRIFSKDRTPRQLALGIALGMMVGLVPKGNLIAVVLATLLFGLKINLGLGLTTAFFITLIGPAADRVSHGLGAFALKTPWVYQSLEQGFQLPVVPWTSLNNTIVLGSTMLALLLFYPTYHVCERTATALQPVVRRWRRQPVPVVPTAESTRLSSAAAPVESPGVSGDVITSDVTVHPRMPGHAADALAIQDALLPTVSELLARPTVLCHGVASQSPAAAPERTESKPLTAKPPTPEPATAEQAARESAQAAAPLGLSTSSARSLDVGAAIEPVNPAARGVPLLAVPSLSACSSPTPPTDPPTAATPTPAAVRTTAAPTGKPAWFKEFALQNSAPSPGQVSSSTPQE